MKRILIYIIVCLLTLLIPVERMDVARLRPVQTVHISRQGDIVVIATDTQDYGQGTDAALALKNMKETASGIIYLDTAEYLLISEDATDQVQLLRAHLKASVTLYQCNAVTDTAAVSQYLDIHGNGPKLKAWKTGDSLPVLQENNGRFIFLKKDENNA